MFREIPTIPPITPLLDQASTPDLLKLLTPEQLPQLAEELRAFLLYTVGQTGGHFGAGLGVIELTVALHYLYDTPRDHIVWDVGHQCYPHKILTGRRDLMASLRQKDGLAGFPKREESPYDTFGVGHSSTSISAALGMALASGIKQTGQKTVAVIGDGAMTAGIAFEALNHAAYTRANMLVVLNDNQMSISHNQGGLATYFAKLWASKLYTNVREGGKKVLSHLPPAWELVRRTEEHMKGMVSPATLFEEMGFNYIGLIDGHDLPDLLTTIGNMKDLTGPQLLHITTQKGKGFEPAELDPVGYHAITKIEVSSPTASEPKDTSKPKKKYQQIFGQWLCDMAEQDPDLIAITPAMCDGSGMNTFAQRFPQRFFDVAIAEQHAITLAAGLACEGLKPVVAIYSTFLQRGYDQLIHDVALQDLDVTFAIDRAGLVGEDGPTHAGSFDLSFLRCIPNMIIMAPSDENECRQMLYTGYKHQGPAAIRYPRGTGPGVDTVDTMTELAIGKGVTKRQGQQIAIVNFGSLLPEAIKAAESLNATVVDMRFVKPLDTALLDELANTHQHIVTLEENTIIGGAGSAVGEYLLQQFPGNSRSVSLLNLGLPDQFISHGKHGELLADIGLNAVGIERSINTHIKTVVTK